MQMIDQLHLGASVSKGLGGWVGSASLRDINMCESQTCLMIFLLSEQLLLEELVVSEHWGFTHAHAKYD